MRALRRLISTALFAAVALPGGARAGASDALNAKLSGEWVLSYTTKDANHNRLLDEPERQPADTAAERNSATGFLRFEAAGRVEMDRKLRFKGRYEIVAQEPRDQIVLVFDDKDIGTYRMLVIEVTADELVLETGFGMFNVYRRARTGVA